MRWHDVIQNLVNVDPNDDGMHTNIVFDGNLDDTSIDFRSSLNSINFKGPVAFVSSQSDYILFGCNGKHFGSDEKAFIEAVQRFYFPKNFNHLLEEP